jgi:hypothetical protein
VGVAGKASVGGPGVNVGRRVKILVDTTGEGRPPVTVAIRVAVGPVLAAGLQARATRPAQ